ncbi:hypothetical protein [Shouchella patagoniensis]|uniref:hypothetical protein n=1 Tax=Shouchella patagoniensis TaxID=228576 RepID=UPI0009957C65|nr:hypothetical protein [Shouchella patagoniensis]
MGQRIGNVGTLNLLKATPESIAEYDYIGNVGLVLYNQQTAPLLSKLSIGNIGQTISLEGDAKIITGVLTIDSNYLKLLEESTPLLVNGVVIVTPNVTETELKETGCSLIVNGVIYTPTQLKSAVQTIVKSNSGLTLTYEGVEPIIKNGNFELTNQFLDSITDKAPILINGLITLAQDLDTALFHSKVERIDVNGKALLYQEQETTFSAKATVNGKIEVIPAGFMPYRTSLQLNMRSIRKFKNQRMYTNKPIIFEKEINRDQFSSAFQSIHSTSYIICHEEIEDLVYETLNLIETEVFVYTEAIRYVKNEKWSIEDINALDLGTTIVVHEKLTLPEVIDDLIAKRPVISIIGELHVPNNMVKAAVQSLVQTYDGLIVNTSTQEDTLELHNIGELSL